MFKRKVSLSPGANSLVVGAEDGPGNPNSRTITVNRLTDTEPPVFRSMNVDPAQGESGQIFDIEATLIDAWSGVDASSIRCEVKNPAGTAVDTLTPSPVGNVFNVLWDSGDVML